MKFVTISAFVFIALHVVCNGQSTSLQTCIEAVEYLITRQPIRTCDYMSDAVRCTIRDMDMLDDVSQKETIKDLANKELTNKGCTSPTFDYIYDAVYALPELLDLQGCFDAAAQEDTWRCGLIDDAIRCALFGDLALISESAPADVLGYARITSDRYLDALNCGKTFDEIRDKLINSGTTVSPTVWLTTVMVGCIMVWKTIF